MNILDRLFLKQFLKPFGACLLAFLLCMVVYDLYDNLTDFIQARSSLITILRYYFILVPAWVVLIMPLTLLLALLYVLSDMSKHGELTSMRASGLNFFRLMGPYFILGLCVSIQMLSLNLAWAPTALYQAKELFDENTRKTANPGERLSAVVYRDVAGNRFWNIKLLDPVTQSATDIEVTECAEDRAEQIRRLSAASGVYRGGHWIFSNVSLYDYRVPNADPKALQRFASLEVPEFTESPGQIILGGKKKKTKRMTTRELLDNLRHANRLSAKQRALFSTEFHARIAFPMGNLVVFLIGVPFGVVGQRRSTFLAVVNALLVFFSYWGMMEVMRALGQTGRVPGWLAGWLPNILFGSMGLLLIRRIR